ncbi:hypothetical protein [Undibacterium sp. Xuan67W]|uniref:hypothetical protein n=1 Tax=Undibacterium sp. Xuan67W TaxID=3413057 RepID=UPI003BF10C6C
MLQILHGSGLENLGKSTTIKSEIRALTLTTNNSCQLTEEIAKMKLSLISIVVCAYTVIVVAWICMSQANI